MITHQPENHNAKHEIIHTRGACGISVVKPTLDDLLSQCDYHAPMPEKDVEFERLSAVGKELL